MSDKRELNKQVIRSIVDIIDGAGNLTGMIDGLLADEYWSDEVVDDLWAALRVKSDAHVYLLYLFRAAMRAGDIRSETTIYNDAPDAGDDTWYDVAITDKDFGETEWMDVHAMLFGKFTVQGQPWSMMTSFTATERSRMNAIRKLLQQSHTPNKSTRHQK